MLRKRNVVSYLNDVWTFSLIKVDPDRLSNHTHLLFIFNNYSGFIDALSKTMAAIQKKKYRNPE